MNITIFIIFYSFTKMVVKNNKYFLIVLAKAIYDEQTKLSIIIIQISLFVFYFQ